GIVEVAANLAARGAEAVEVAGRAAIGEAGQRAEWLRSGVQGSEPAGRIAAMLGEQVGVHGAPELAEEQPGLAITRTHDGAVVGGRPHVEQREIAFVHGALNVGVPVRAGLGNYRGPIGPGPLEAVDGSDALVRFVLCWGDPLRERLIRPQLTPGLDDGMCQQAITLPGRAYLVDAPPRCGDALGRGRCGRRFGNDAPGVDAHGGGAAGERARPVTDNDHGPAALE